MKNLNASHQRHTNYFYLFIEHLNEIYQQDAGKALASFDENLPQIRKAFQWASDNMQNNRIAAIFVYTYVRMADLLIEISLTPLEQEFWHQAALQAARLEDEESLQAVFLNNLGSLEQLKGNYQMAIAYIKEAMAIANQVQNKTEISRSTASLGRIYGNIGKFEEATRLLKTALVLAQEDKSPRLEARILGEMGLLFVEHEDYEDAIILLEQALEISRSLGQSELNLMLELGSLGTAYVHSGDYEKGIAIFEKNLSLAKTIGDKSECARSLSGLGTAYSQLKQFTQAVAAFQEAIKIADERDEQLAKGKRLVNLALVYAKLEDELATHATLHQALQIFQQLKLDYYINIVLDYLKRLDDAIE